MLIDICLSSCYCKTTPNLVLNPQPEETSATH